MSAFLHILCILMNLDHENRERRKRRATNRLFPECPQPIIDLDTDTEPFMTSPNSDIHTVSKRYAYDTNAETDHEENIEPDPQPDEQQQFASSLSLSAQEFLPPPDETLRSAAVRKSEDDVEVEVIQSRCENYNYKPHPEVSTILPCPSSPALSVCSKCDEQPALHNMDEDKDRNRNLDSSNIPLKTTFRVMTRSQTKLQQMLISSTVPMRDKAQY